MATAGEAVDVDDPSPGIERALRVAGHHVEVDAQPIAPPTSTWKGSIRVAPPADRPRRAQTADRRSAASSPRRSEVDDVTWIRSQATDVIVRSTGPFIARG